MVLASPYEGAPLRPQYADEGMMGDTRRCLIGAAAFSCLAMLGAPSHGDAVPPLMTVQDLMEFHIDPAADALWDSVAFISTLKGDEDRRPRTPAQWAAVRRSALKLIQGAADLKVPGRRVSVRDASSLNGELRSPEIDHLIERDPEAFAKRADALKAAARTALAAIDSKDADALMTAGGVIDGACEACHKVYWYPGRLQERR